jgi:iturin family lipopeptide synthetase A
VLARLGPEGRSLPVAPGVPSGLVGDVLVLPYGEPASLDAIRKHAHELAAVMVEPVQSRYPEHQPVEFLREIRAITEQSGTAFIFDEVIFGLRAAPGGAQQIFGIAPDLSCYGKILGGGMPIGAVAGKARFLDAIDGGQWRFGDDSYPQAEMTFFAGTFCKHPVVMAACDAVLDRFLLEGDKITRDLSARTSQLTKRLNQLLEGSDIEANCFSSLFRFKSPTNIDLLFANINLRGAYVWEGRNLFLSTEHTDQDLDLFVNIVGDSIDELRREGFVRKKP